VGYNQQQYFGNWVAKLAKIVMVSILRSMEDECTFSMLAFMKNKLHNRLGTNLDTIVRMFAHNLIHMKVYFIRMQPQHGKIGKCRLVLPLERFGFLISKCFYSHNLDTFGEDNYLFMSFINIWVWWVGFWVMMGEVWFQTKVQLPLKVLMLV
jgi:hypothetical protein